jgi:hypothetical protein
MPLKPIITRVNTALIPINIQASSEKIPPHRRINNDVPEEAVSLSADTFSMRSKEGLTLTVPSSLVST